MNLAVKPLRFEFLVNNFRKVTLMEGYLFQPVIVRITPQT